MEAAAKQSSAAIPVYRKIISLFGRLLVALIMLIMVVLVFFLLQSRIAGGTPAVAGYQLYIVLSGSMSPAFEAGSVVLVRPLEPAAVQERDIITYHDPDPEKEGTITTHRVVAINQTEPLSFTTRGDANDADDLLPVAAGDLIGRVEYNIPYMGNLFNFVRTPTGLLLLVIVPAILIIATELRKLLGYAQALEKEKAEGGGYRG